MDKVQAAEKFEAKGHPKGYNLDTRQKMLYLRLEIIYRDMATEIVEYSMDNDFRAQAIQALFESRELAIKSVLEEGKKYVPLVADGQTVAQTPPKEVREERATPLAIPEPEKKKEGKRGRPKKS